MAEYFQHSIKLIEIWLILQRRITGPKMVYKDNEGEREGRNLGLVLFKASLRLRLDKRAVPREP